MSSARGLRRAIERDTNAHALRIKSTKRVTRLLPRQGCFLPAPMVAIPLGLRAPNIGSYIRMAPSLIEIVNRHLRRSKP